MIMSLVVLAIVLGSFALGFRFADIRAEAMDRVLRDRSAETAWPPATERRRAAMLPERSRAAPARRAMAGRPAARVNVGAAAASRS